MLLDCFGYGMKWTFCPNLGFSHLYSRISCSFLHTSESHSSLCTISPLYLEFASSSRNTPSPSSMDLQWCRLCTFFATSGAVCTTAAALCCQSTLFLTHSHLITFSSNNILRLVIIVYLSTLDCKLHESRAFCFLFTSTQNSCRHSTTMNE